MIGGLIKMMPMEDISDPESAHENLSNQQQEESLE